MKFIFNYINITIFKEFTKKSLCFLAYFILISNILQGSSSKIQNLEIKVEFLFDKFELKDCLDHLFILASYHERNQDSLHLVQTWSSIAILNSILHKPYHTKAAIKIADEYTNKNKASVYLQLAKLFDSKKNTEIKSNFEKIQKLYYQNSLYKKFKFYYLLKLDYQFSNEQKNKINIISEIKKMQIDSLWFGYGNYLYILGIEQFEQKKYREAIVLFRSTISIYSKLNVITSYYLQSYSYLMQAYHNLEESKSEDICFIDYMKLENSNLLKSEKLGEFYIIKGTYYFLNKRYPEAYIAYNLALNNFPNSIKNNNPYVNNIISTCFYMQDYNKVIHWSSLLKGPSLPYHNLMIAYSYLKIGNKVKAMALWNTINKDQFIKKYETRPSIIFWMASFYLELKDYKKTEQYLNCYVAASRNFFGEYHILTAQSYSNMAYYQWIYKNDIEKALYYYQYGLSTLLKQPFEPDIFKIPEIPISVQRDDIVMCLRNKGEALLEIAKKKSSKEEQIKYLSGCVDNFRLAFKALNKYKFALLSEEKKLRYATLTHHYYSYVTEACIRLYHITGDKTYANEAFQFIESSKSSLLLSMIRGEGARKMKMIPSKLTKKEDYIRDNTDKYTKLLIDENNKRAPNLVNLDKYNEYLLNLRRQQDSLIRIFENKYPVYYNLKYGAAVSCLDSIQAKLKPNQALIEYSLNGNILYIFLVTHNDYKIITEPISSNFYDKLDNYRKSLTQFKFSDTKDNVIYNYSNNAYSLYTILLKPVENNIKGKSLIIIPDDVLNNIPLEPLVTQNITKRNDINYRDLPYLIKQHTIIYNYSASLIPALNNRSTLAHTSKLLALAPVSTNFTLKKILNDNINRDSNTITPIPGTIEEVKNINKLFGGKLLIGKEATEKKFKYYSDKYDIIHIASHGFVNNKYPLYSRLVFNPDNDSINDGLLNTYEIYGMHISAPLVVLSACNTGYGKLYKGEGTISLARGFYVAGAKNILMTLWAVTDKTSNKLVQQFYSQLALGETVPKSIQEAKIEFIKNADEISAHPYFWAGYISIGDPEIHFSKPFVFPVKQIITLLSALIILVFGYFILKRK